MPLLVDTLNEQFNDSLVLADLPTTLVQSSKQRLLDYVGNGSNDVMARHPIVSLLVYELDE
jgi:hypothetical protein